MIQLTMIISFVLTLLHPLLQPLEATLTRSCLHIDQDYAWGNLEEVVRLGGPSQATLLYGNNHQMYCISAIDPLTMQAQNLEDESQTSLANKTCHALIKEFSNLLQERAIQPGDLKFIIPFGSRLYYFNNNLKAFQFYSIKSIFDVKFNQDFDMPQIHKWINSKLNNYQNEAVVFLRRGREVPQYPSLIISTAESGHPSTFYYHQTEEKTGEGVFRKLGTSQFRVKAMYVQSRKYEPVKTALAFFDAYYGTVRFRLNQSKESKEELEIFPVLPVQGILGCPVHLCWWPYLEDIVYHAGVYYLFQGQWMFVFVEGTAEFDPLKPENAINLHSYSITQTIFTAFYDPFSQHLRLVHYWGSHIQGFNAKGVNVTLSKTASGSQSATVKLLDDKRLTIDLERRDKVIASVVLKGVLWFSLFKEKQEAIQFHGFTYDNASASFKHSMTIAKTPFRSMVAMFYHPRLDHLFIVSGFFLYLFQKADLNTVEQSFCSVTPFYRLFNCSGYHDLKRMNSKEPVISSLAAFTENAKKYHHGDFLPGQCNYFEELRLTGAKIHFQKKIPVTPKVKWFESKVVIIGGAVVGGVLFTVALFFVCYSLATRNRSFSGGGGGRGRGQQHLSLSRLNKEKKLKQFLKQQWFAAKGGGGKSSSSSGTMQQLKSTSSASLSNTSNSRRKRNTTTTTKTTNAARGTKRR